MNKPNFEPVRIAFMAIVPITAWVAVIYFCSVVVDSVVRVLEILGEIAQVR